MRNTNSSIPALIIAFLCIAVYAAALIIGAYRFYINVTSRQAIAEREFYDLTDIASAAGVLGFMDVPFQEAIQDGLGRSQTLEGAIISGPSGEYAFERQRGTVIRWEGNSPQFVKRFGISATSAVPLRINELRNVTISAVFRSVDYAYGVTVLKHSLLVILISLTVAFLTFLVEAILVRNQVPEERTRAWPSGYDDEDEDEESEETEPFEEPPARERAKKSKPESQAEEELIPETSDAWTEESLNFAGFEAEADFTGDSEDSAEDFNIPEADYSLEAPDEPETPDSGDGEAKTPQGLYVPGSNIGWEAYTKDRLEAELHRCASFEQDLTVLLLDFSGTTELTSQQYNELAGMAVSFFNLRDLIFEKGKRGITVILPNMDLDQGVSQAEDFINYLTPVFTDMPAFRIGVSSRSGRLVDADRLYFEAAEALGKALHDPVSPIIAFKSDPEKYRAFLRSRSK